MLEGSVVVVVTKDNVFVKRLYHDPNPDYLILKSDNPQTSEDGEHKVSMADVNELMIIRGKITNVLTPQHEELVSNSKIKALEDAIELLKEELFNVNQKLKEIHPLK